MSEYKPLELSPALTWAAAQAVCNPKAAEDDHCKAFNLIAAMPGDVGDGSSNEIAQLGLFSDIFDNHFMRLVMKFFWFTYRARKALNEMRTVVNGPWDD